LNSANFQNYALPLARRVFPGSSEWKPSPFNKKREEKLGIELDGLVGWKVESTQEKNKTILKIEKADIVGLAYAMRYTYDNSGNPPNTFPTSGTGQ